MSADQTYIDRRGAARTRPMEVLALGVGRTGLAISFLLIDAAKRSGTDSIRVALKMLGYDDCYHGYSCLHENPPDNELWLEAADAKFRGKGKPYTKEQWDSLLGDCAGVSDLPCVAFAPELIATYPDAKVVLTLPPKGYDGWYRSCEKTIMAMKEDRTRDAWAWFNHEAWLTRHTFWRIFDDFYEGDFRQNARRIYDEHYARVRELVPPGQLLEYSVTEGWEPLCHFLGKPVPNQEFPRGNDPQAFFRKFEIADGRRRKQTVKNGVLLLLGVGTLGVMFWYNGFMEHVGHFMSPWMKPLR